MPASEITHKLSNCDVEAVGESQQRPERRIDLAPLDMADERAVDAAEVSQLFLGQASLRAEKADALAHQFLRPEGALVCWSPGHVS